MLESNPSAVLATISWAEPVGLPTFHSAQLMVCKAVNSKPEWARPLTALADGPSRRADMEGETDWLTLNRLVFSEDSPHLQGGGNNLTPSPVGRITSAPTNKPELLSNSYSRSPSSLAT